MNVSMMNYTPKSLEEPSTLEAAPVKTIMNDDLELMDSIDLEDDFLLDLDTKLPHISDTFNDPLKDEVSSYDSLGEPQDSMDLDEEMPPMDGTSSSVSNELEDLQDRYKIALKQLATAMKRSEITRNNIIRLRQSAQGESVSANQVMGFLSGSRTTLTSGLEQSRSMLQALASKTI